MNKRSQAAAVLRCRALEARYLRTAVGGECFKGPSWDRSDSELQGIDKQPDVGRGTSSAAAGAVMGLVTVAGSGSLLFLPDYGANFAPRLAAKIALILIYASPYLFALAASRAKRPGTRGGLLLAFGLLSLVASLSSLSLVTLTLLPATIVILFAAARSLTTTIRPLTATLTAGVLGLAVAATVGLSLFTLVGVQAKEYRCQVSTLNQDGQYVSEDRPNLGGPDTLTVGPLSGGTTESTCSEVVSDAEAGMSVGVLTVAFLEMLLISKFRWLWSPTGGRVWAAK